MDEIVEINEKVESGDEVEDAQISGQYEVESSDDAKFVDVPKEPGNGVCFTKNYVCVAKFAPIGTCFLNTFMQGCDQKGTQVSVSSVSEGKKGLRKVNRVS